MKSDDELDLFLDHGFDPQRRAEFARRLAREPELAAQGALQARIDRSLRARFGYAHAAPSGVAVARVAAPERLRRRHALTWIAAAAALLITAFVLWKRRPSESNIDELALVMRAARERAEIAPPSSDTCSLGSGWVQARLGLALVACTSWNTAPNSAPEVVGEWPVDGTPFDACVVLRAGATTYLVWTVAAERAPTSYPTPACGVTIARGRVDDTVVWIESRDSGSELLRALGAAAPETQQ